MRPGAAVEPPVSLSPREQRCLAETRARLEAVSPVHREVYDLFISQLVRRNVPAGWVIPYFSLRQIEHMVASHGYSPQVAVDLFRLGLLDQPGFNTPAAIHLDPGYDGPLYVLCPDAPWRQLTVVRGGR